MLDVARLAGVGTMTVSRALNGGANVSKEKAERVKSAVRQLGYVLDQSAGGLSSKRTGLIAAIVPSLCSYPFSETARGINDAFAASGLHVLLGETDSSPEKEEQVVEAMLRRRPEGVLIAADVHSDRTRQMLKTAGVPVVETWEMPSEPLGHVVGFSNESAMRALVESLIAKGYSRFVYVGNEVFNDMRGLYRQLGFTRALAAAGLPHDRLVVTGKAAPTSRQGADAAVRILEEWPDTDMVVCASDLAALGVVMECARRGVRVPQQLAISGFGNYEFGDCCHPGITTVDVGSYDIGVKAGEQLRAAIANPAAVNAIVNTPYNVVFRGSA
jgi:LacI family gluconate utilization system Gnt-I transcriptional repressor